MWHGNVSIFKLLSFQLKAYATVKPAQSWKNSSQPKNNNFFLSPLKELLNFEILVKFYLHKHLKMFNRIFIVVKNGLKELEISHQNLDLGLT